MASGILRQTLNDFRKGRDLEAGASLSFFDALVSERDVEVLFDILAAWNEKGIAEEEIFHLASIMRSKMKRISSDHGAFVDAVGTGGSRAKTFNVSTAAAFVIAGADVPVAKHGNRAASSKTGSADVLSKLGIRVDVEPETAERCLNEHGICFMFAPKFHSLSPELANARHKFGKPTIFNCLGPLCNPGGAPHQLIGAWNEDIARSIANALSRLGTKRSWVVHGSDGLDEITFNGTTAVFEVCCGSIREFEIAPKDFGLIPIKRGAISAVRNAAESAAIVRSIVNNERADEAAESLVLINAAAAIYLTGAADDLSNAVATARESLRNGNAKRKLISLIEATNL